MDTDFNSGGGRWRLSHRTLIALLLLLGIHLPVQALEISVQLVNGLSGEPLSGQRIDARRKQSDGKFKWAKRATTGDDGSAAFSLDAGTYRFAAKPYGQRAYSAETSRSGNARITAGLLPVTLISGLDGEVLPETKVHLQKRNAEGKFKWFAGGYTDGDGRIVFEPTQLNSGAVYRLTSKSLVDNSNTYSANISSTGPMTYSVGNQPLTVTLTDAISGDSLAGVKLVAKERLADGSSKWVRRSDTDDNGQAVFDLPGLGADRSYFIAAYAYHNLAVYSDDLNQPGELAMRVGTTPVTLIDGDSGQPVAGIKLAALEQKADGGVKWRQQATTDEQGVVRFDLPALSEGTPYSFRVKDVYGEGVSRYSPWVGGEGPYTFTVSKSDDQRYDKDMPEVAIDAPTADSLVPASGFSVSGSAWDKRGVASVTVRIEDPVLGVSETQAVLDDSGLNWRADVADGLAAAGNSVILTALARDRMGNTTEHSVSVQAINDTEAPILEVRAPYAGERVPASGFFARGEVFDNTGQVSLNARIGGTSIPVEIAANGQWGFAVPTGILNTAGNATLSLSAVDQAGNVNERPITLTVGNAESGIPHLLARTSFGATPDTLEQVRAIGWEAYVMEQLNPESIADPALEAVLADWTLESTRDLQNYPLLHAVYSERQLLEVMTAFWDNHFNTYLPKHGRRDYELAENDAFRAHAFGKFRDLLAISAHSPAMMIYLDNHRSYKTDPNENYARELLELHTMGVDGGYSAGDIAEIARAFTGWRVKDRAFYFDARRHDDGEKTVLGQTIPAGGGMEDGELILDLLATHPSTANYLCGKLIQRFIADEPPADAVAGCADSFLNSGGDMRQVVQHILLSVHFTQTGSFKAKVKTPFELITSAVRGLNAYLAEADMQWALNSLSQRPFYNPIPTGWGETGDKWISSSQSLGRITLVNRTAFNRVRDSRTHITPQSYFQELGLETAQSIVDYSLHLLLGNDFTALEQSIAYGVLNGDGSPPFALDADDADQRLRQMLGSVLSFPSFNLQ